ncbi:F-box/WD repeat-containing protein lin-23 [Fulvia fulva]|nr:F-box/WD repeat-containing protein lin-23 [Fulvia fulva]
MSEAIDGSMGLDQDTRRFAFPHPDHGVEGHQASIYAIDLKPPYLLSGSADRTIKIWDVQTQRIIRGPLIGHEGSSTDASIIIWRFSTGELVERIVKSHEETVLDLCFDDKYLVTGSKNKSVKIWSRPSTFEAELVGTLDLHGAAVNVVLTQKQTDGSRILFTGSGDHTISMWSLRHSGSELETNHVRNFTTHRTGIAAMDVFGDQLISGSSDNAVKIHDIHAGTTIASLEGHTNLIRTVQVIAGANGLSTVVSGSYDGTIRFWRRSKHETDAGSLPQQWSEVDRLEYDGANNPESTDAELAKRFGEGKRIFDLRVSSHGGHTK